MLGVNSLWFCAPFQVCLFTCVSLVFSAHLPTRVWLKLFPLRKTLTGLDMVPFSQMHGTAPVWCFLEALEALTRSTREKDGNPGSMETFFGEVTPDINRPLGLWNVLGIRVSHPNSRSATDLNTSVCNTLHPLPYRPDPLQEAC